MDFHGFDCVIRELKNYTCMTSRGIASLCVEIGHMFKNRKFWTLPCISGMHMFLCITSWISYLDDAELQETYEALWGFVAASCAVDLL